MASGVALRESVKEMKRLKNEPLLMLAIIAIILFVGFFVVYPVIRVITFPSGQDYMQLFQKARWFTALKNSLFMTLISTVSCTAVAFLFAYVIARLDVPCKGLFRFVTLLPIVSPPFIVALSYILLFGVQGIVTKQLLGLHVDIYGRLGLWIVQTVTFFPYAYSVIYGVIRSISTNLEYAAYNMGAPRWRVFKDVFWPLCRPGVAGGALVAAINVLTDFGNPQMIGGDLALLPTEAYMQISGWYDMKTASVLALSLIHICCVVKQSAVAPEMLRHKGPARVFNSEEEAIAVIYAGGIRPGDVVVIRYEGPKGLSLIHICAAGGKERDLRRGGRYVPRQRH